MKYQHIGLMFIAAGILASYLNLSAHASALHAAAVEKDAALGLLLDGKDDGHAIDSYIHAERIESYQQLQMTEAAIDLVVLADDLDYNTVSWSAR